MSELQKYLRYRYELAERALFHHGKLAADAMTIKLFETWLEWQVDIQAQSALTGNRREKAKAATPKDRKRYLQAARAKLERLCRDHGDDSLLEIIRYQAEAESSKSRQARTVARLADDLLSRTLFKGVATYTQSIDRASDIHDKFKSSELRQKLELEVARFAEMSHEDLAVWLPSPDMKLKVAEVLVQNQSGVCELSKLEDDPCRAIVEAHRRLWGIALYVHPRLKRDSRVQRARARLADLLEIQWDDDGHAPGDSVLSLVMADAGVSKEAMPQIKDGLRRSAAFSARGQKRLNYRRLLRQAKKLLATPGGKRAVSAKR
jgi:hypothetical protein